MTKAFHAHQRGRRMLIDLEMEPSSLMDALYPSRPRHVEKGIYDNCHFNFSNFLPKSMILASYETELPDDLEAYGVCDSIEQWKDHYRALIQLANRYFTVGFTEVRRADQTASGGWRWHKWGPYIGTHEPQCEYLYDEIGIDAVLTFSVVEKVFPPIFPNRLM